jgi:hypothetical protein
MASLQFMVGNHLMLLILTFISQHPILKYPSSVYLRLPQKLLAEHQRKLQVLTTPSLQGGMPVIPMDNTLYTLQLGQRLLGLHFPIDSPGSGVPDTTTVNAVASRQRKSYCRCLLKKMFS